MDRDEAAWLTLAWILIVVAITLGIIIHNLGPGTGG